MTLPCACTTVRKANRALFRFYETAMSGSGLTVTQFSILRALQRNGPTPLPALADELIMERTSLYRTIAPLADKGAIDLTDDGTGKRKTATLTVVGEQLITEAAPYWQRAQDHIVSSLGEDIWQQMSTLLLDIPNHISSPR